MKVSRSWFLRRGLPAVAAGLTACRNRGPEETWEAQTIEKSNRPNRNLATYLDQHPNIRQAMISLEGTPYDQWTKNPQIILHRFFTALERSEPLPLSFEGRPRGMEGRPNRLSDTIAAEISLAHLAQSLWLEINQMVPWRLHDYDEADLLLLLDGRNMFSDQYGYFEPNKDLLGSIMPSNPTSSYSFMLNNPEGGTLIRDNQRNTIFALTEWMMGHLIHAYTNRFRRLSNHPSELLPTIEQMTNRQISNLRRYDGEQRDIVSEPNPRYWSPRGCWSATGFMVMLLKTLNIPARNFDTMPERREERLSTGISIWRGSSHSGIGFPAEGLYLEHTDNICIIEHVRETRSWSYGFPALEADQVYLTTEEFNRFRSIPNEWGEQNQAYLRRLISVGSRQPTYPFLKAFHESGRRGLQVFLRPDGSELFNSDEVAEIEGILRETIRRKGGFANIEAEYQRQRAAR